VTDRIRFQEVIGTTNSRSRMISRRRGLRLRGVLKSTLSSRRRANAERALIWNWN